MPRARMLGGSVSTAVRSPPGNVAAFAESEHGASEGEAGEASPSHACDMLAAVQTPTASSMPTRRPTRSSTDPHTGLPSV